VRHLTSVHLPNFCRLFSYRTSQGQNFVGIAKDDAARLVQLPRFGLQKLARGPSGQARRAILFSCIGCGRFGTVYHVLSLNAVQERSRPKRWNLRRLCRRATWSSGRHRWRPSSTKGCPTRTLADESLAQTLKAHGKLSGKLVVIYVFNILEGPLTSQRRRALRPQGGEPHDESRERKAICLRGLVQLARDGARDQGRRWHVEQEGLGRPPFGNIGNATRSDWTGVTAFFRRQKRFRDVPYVRRQAPFARNCSCMRSSRSVAACTSTADSLTRLPNHHNGSASSSLSTVTSGNEGARTLARTHLSIFSPPPVAHKVLSPFKRPRASLTPDTTQSNSSVSLAPVAVSDDSDQRDIGGRRELSIILTRQREPQSHKHAPERTPPVDLEHRLVVRQLATGYGAKSM
jgi:hypothetical protein